MCATDRDTGENGRVRYDIDRRRSDPLSHFSVDSVTGEISVRRRLDYEMRESYDLVVVASDNGTQRLQTSAIVSVSVVDVNDNAPLIDVRFVAADGSGRVSEGVRVGDPVARVSVSDPDVKTGRAGVNVTLTAHHGHLALTTRDATVYLVVVSAPLTGGDTYRLTVVATDSGVPPLSTVRELSVFVGAGSGPRFALAVYHAHVQGGVAGRVGRVEAWGRGEVRYHLEPPSALFSVSERTGLISARSPLACDARSLTMTVVAISEDTPSQSATATVIVHVREVRQNPPVFSESFYEVFVDEDTREDTCIIQVRRHVSLCVTRLIMSPSSLLSLLCSVMEASLSKH